MPSGTKRKAAASVMDYKGIVYCRLPRDEKQSPVTSGKDLRKASIKCFSCLWARDRHVVLVTHFDNIIADCRYFFHDDMVIVIFKFA